MAAAFAHSNIGIAYRRGGGQTKTVVDNNPIVVHSTLTFS
jgi:hypothetical protein